MIYVFGVYASPPFSSPPTMLPASEDVSDEPYRAPKLVQTPFLIELPQHPPHLLSNKLTDILCPFPPSYFPGVFFHRRILVFL